MLLVDVVSLSTLRCKNPIKAELKYATDKNFVGRPIAGYHEKAIDVALLEQETAEQLCEVQNYLCKNHPYSLIIYDAYRPKRAILDFINWTRQPNTTEQEKNRKEKYYPRINKNQFFSLGYVMEDSGHCYGNTVDVFLIDRDGKELDMGVRYDYMDELSHLTVVADRIGEKAYNNRMILKQAMEKFGFHSYEKEFWHYSYLGDAGRKIPTPLDLEITPDKKLMGISYASNV